MVSKVQTATLVQKHYNNVIRIHNPQAKVWLKRSIYNHFEIECPSHGVIRHFAMRTLHHSLRTIVTNQLYRIHEESGLEEVDLKCVKPMLMIVKELRPLLNECSRINSVF